MKLNKIQAFIIFIFFITIFNNCIDNKKFDKSTLNEFQLKHGIGPIKKSIDLIEIDTNNVKEGRIIFQTKCTSCHRLDTKLVGPALRNVIELRNPEYIINMMVNPVDMTLYHPVAKKLAEEYGSQMTFQNVKLNDAFKILDYLRYENKNSK